MTIAWPTEHTGLVTEPPLDMSIYSSAHPPACIESRQSRVYLVIVAAAFSTPTTYQPTKREMRSPLSSQDLSVLCVWRAQRGASRVAGVGVQRLGQGADHSRTAQGRIVGGLEPKLHSLGAAG